MANPAWSDAVRDRLHRRLGVGLGLGDFARAAALLFHPMNSKILAETTDENAAAKLSSWQLTAGKRETDTDADGWVYCTLTDETPGAGQARLQCWSDSARSVLVAQGDAADSATLTLTPQAGKNLAGTVKLGAITATFSFRFQLIKAPIVYVDDVFDGAEIDDSTLREQLKAGVAEMRALFQQAEGVAGRLSADIEQTLIRRNLKGLSAGTALISPNIRRRSTGLVIEEPRGLLEDHRQGMADNASGSGVVKALGPTQSAAVTFPGSWSGRLNGSVLLGTRGRPGVITLTCTKTFPDGVPEFQAVLKLDDSRLNPDEGRGSLVFSQVLTIGAQWIWPEAGIEGVTIDYAPTAANSTGTSLSTTSTDWGATNLKPGNSDLGKLWTYYTGTILKFYKSEAGRDAQNAEELVAQKTIAATNTAFTTDEGELGLTVTGKTGAALASGDKGSVDFNAPDATQPASYFLITLSETVRAGRWLSRFRDGGFGASNKWEPHVAASPNLKDGHIAFMPLTHAGVYGDRD